VSRRSHHLIDGVRIAAEQPSGHRIASHFVASSSQAVRRIVAFAPRGRPVPSAAAPPPDHCSRSHRLRNDTALASRPAQNGTAVIADRTAPCRRSSVVLVATRSARRAEKTKKFGQPFRRARGMTATETARQICLDNRINIDKTMCGMFTSYFKSKPLFLG